jgi:hypothetical protein
MLVWYIGLRLVSTMVSQTLLVWYDLTQYQPCTSISLVGT